jgi:GntR family transcriptional regulator/MocR family aminotransferase
MVFCTPSHQFPLGFRLSLKRRNALLKWAQVNDALILEDDYSHFEINHLTKALKIIRSEIDRFYPA